MGEARPRTCSEVLDDSRSLLGNFFLFEKEVGAERARRYVVGLFHVWATGLYGDVARRWAGLLAEDSYSQ